MQLRQLRPDEGLAYRDVRPSRQRSRKIRRSLREAPEAFASTFDEESTQPEAFWLDLVARTVESMEATMFTIERPDGTHAATTFVRVSPDPPHDAYIGAMWVDADLRGPRPRAPGASDSRAPGASDKRAPGTSDDRTAEESWADSLLRAAEQFARRLGSQTITLWVSESNPAAQRFYDRNGYRPTGQSEPQPSGITAHLLHKPL